MTAGDTGCKHIVSLVTRSSCASSSNRYCGSEKGDAPFVLRSTHSLGQVSELDFTLLLFLAFVMLWAGLAKLRNLRAFRHALTTYGLVPAQMTGPLAVAVPGMEIALAIGLLSGRYTELAAWAGVGLFTAFSAVQAGAYLYGFRFPCHCFGEDAFDQISLATVWRNIGLLIASSTIAVFSPEATRPTAAEVALLAPAALALALLVVYVWVFKLALSFYFSRPWLAPTPINAARVSFREAGLDVSLVPTVSQEARRE